MGDIKRKNINLDGVVKEKKQIPFFDLPLSQFVRKYKKSSVLFSRAGRTESFFTRDSKLYYTPEELRILQGGGRVARNFGRIDGLSSRSFENSRIYSLGQQDLLFLSIRRKYRSLGSYMGERISGRFEGVSMVRMWNISIVSAVIFGMVMMTMIYRYLGQSVSAQIEGATKPSVTVEETVAGVSTNEGIDEETITKLFKDYSALEDKEAQRQAFEDEIREMVKGYPIEKMVTRISQKDRTVAAFVVAIAKKESAWGKRVPVLDGQDCYNYWGYRGIRDKMGTGGHTCFNSPEDAVDTVARRIEFLVSNEKLNTPQKMSVWKCGYDCSWDSPAAVQKWISDVDMYFKKLNKTKE
jgi:hypothetical protein